MIKQALPSTSSSFKTITATTKEIEEHYDRGNDFFAAFLGPAMVSPSCSSRQPSVGRCSAMIRCFGVLGYGAAWMSGHVEGI